MITAETTPSLLIVVFGFPGCPNIEPTIRSLTSVAASLQLNAAITCQFVSEADDLTKIGFRGSPTVLIDGVDIDPEVRARGECNYGCRLYATSGTPSREMISSAILRALAATDLNERDCLRRVKIEPRNQLVSSNDGLHARLSNHVLSALTERRYRLH